MSSSKSGVSGELTSQIYFLRQRQVQTLVPGRMEYFYDEISVKIIHKIIKDMYLNSFY